MDIVDLILEDHQKIMDLFKKISNTPDVNTDERTSLFGELRSALDSHTVAEERNLYEGLENNDELREKILESYEDHKVVASLLQSISEMEVNDPDWIARIEVLRENVETHIEEEERTVLPVAQIAISDAERGEMGNDMESLEDEIVSAGPGFVTQTPAQTMLGTIA
jgi:hemerythrin-like domain-containing protein